MDDAVPTDPLFGHGFANIKPKDAVNSQTKGNGFSDKQMITDILGHRCIDEQGLKGTRAN